MTDPLSSAEERIVELVREGRDELVALVAELVALDTTARFVGDPPRDEVRLQQTLGARLRAIGAEVDIWEPEPTGRATVSCPTTSTSRGGHNLPPVWRAAAAAARSCSTGTSTRSHLGRVEDWKTDPFTKSPLKTASSGVAGSTT